MLCTHSHVGPRTKIGRAADGAMTAGMNTMNDTDDDSLRGVQAACILGNYAVFAICLYANGVKMLPLALLMIAAIGLGHSMSGPLFRYVVARWMLGAKGGLAQSFANTIAPVLLHAAAACIIWIVWHVF